MNSNRKIIIHVGPPKTGSSAIQAWLTNHRDLLKDKFGVFYPEHSLDRNNISSGSKALLAEKSKDKKWEVSHSAIAKTLDMFDQSGCETLLLSSEFCFLNIQQLDEAIPNATFVVYIRHPVESFESGYNQLIKRTPLVKKISEMTHGKKSIWDRLESIYSSVDESRIVLRPYHHYAFG